MKQICNFTFLRFIVFLYCAVPAGVHAAGIPVVDQSSIAQQIASQAETILKWKLQYDQMVEQINQAKRQLEAMSGPRGMGTLHDGAAARLNLPEEWQALAGKALPSYPAHRARYPESNYRKQNEVFDLIASYNATLDEIYKSSTARSEQVNKLMGEIETATDPAAKADLANRLINEQNAIEASRQTIAVLEARHKEELKAAQSEASREYMCLEFERDDC